LLQTSFCFKVDFAFVLGHEKACCFYVVLFQLLKKVKNGTAIKESKLGRGGGVKSVLAVSFL
jgi:hypothetical protein